MGQPTDTLINNDHVQEQKKILKGPGEKGENFAPGKNFQLYIIMTMTLIMTLLTNWNGLIKRSHIHIKELEWSY